MLDPGQLLCDRYQIQQQLSKKAGRRTLLACDLQTQEQVAIKVLIFGSDFEWEDLKLFEREAETLKALDHPAIPRYLDFSELDLPQCRGFALVQTYIAAKSLAEYLKVGRTFSELEVKELAKSLLKILIYLHGRQPPVIHRDIKPSNILLGDRSGNSIGQVYLVDFGSVQTLAAQEGGTITVVGTYGYMPPEQFGDRATPASDLYALGATLIHLVTGIAPAELLKNSQIQFIENTNLTTSFFEWLKKLTMAAAEQRFFSASEALKMIDCRIKSPAIRGHRPHLDSGSLSLRSLLVISRKTKEKLEIRKKGEIGKDYRLIILLIVLWTVIIILFLRGTYLFFTIAYMILFFWFLSANRKTSIQKSKKQDAVICLDARQNSFDFTTRWSSGKCKLTHIKYVYLSAFNQAVGYGSDTAIISHWCVIISADRKHQLNWDLTEEEGIWLVNEIQTWLSSANI
jgi:serine/threonine protein kinase